MHFRRLSWVAVVIAAGALTACGRVAVSSTDAGLACSGGTTVCGDTCADTQVDPDNCGACGTACTDGQVCAAGQCSLTCVGGTTVCGDRCVDTSSDPDDCGVCGSACAADASCVAGACKLLFTPHYYVLTSTPTPATVFNTIDETYKFTNNLTNSIWNREWNTIFTGDYTTSAYWAFPATTTTYPTTANVGTDVHARMVQIPATSTVIYTRAASGNGVGLGTAANVAVASISLETGLLTPGQAAVFSDAFAGSCQLTSSSATEFFCYDGTQVRVYTTAVNSAVLTFETMVELSTPLPTAAQCAPNAACYGSTFAFDGAYYYFASDEGLSTNLAYVVYDKTGALVGTDTATGAGAINGVYFDWSVGRYSTHDGFGARTGGTAYGPTGSDTHCFGPIATTHTLE